MTLMQRRRALMGVKEEEQIPIGVNFFVSSDPDYVSGKYISGATVGTTNITWSTWSVYKTSGYMPYNSNNIFRATNATSNTSRFVVLDKDDVVIYYGSDASKITGVAGQELIQTAEASLNRKATCVRISATTNVTYMRES